MIAYVVLAPFAGGLLAGLDRKVSAWMQGRVGPPFSSPSTMLKLLRKEKIAVNRFQNFFVFLFFLFMIFTGSLFFAGANLLLVIFALMLASLFLVLAGFSVNSPYSHLGAERELIQMMAYDPAVIILAIGFYVVTGSFEVGSIYQASREGYLIVYLPGIFAAYLYVLTIKFRKSPFDLSISHHAHQEIVRGLTTEFSGPHLALIEVAHWYENILLLALIYLFFSFSPLDRGRCGTARLFRRDLCRQCVRPREVAGDVRIDVGLHRNGRRVEPDHCSLRAGEVRYVVFRKIPLGVSLQRIELQRVRSGAHRNPHADVRSGALRGDQHGQPEARGHTPDHGLDERAERCRSSRTCTTRCRLPRWSSRSAFARRRAASSPRRTTCWGASTRCCPSMCTW